MHAFGELYKELIFTSKCGVYAPHQNLWQIHLLSDLNHQELLKCHGRPLQHLRALTRFGGISAVCKSVHRLLFLFKPRSFNRQMEQKIFFDATQHILVLTCTPYSSCLFLPLSCPWFIARHSLQLYCSTEH